MKQIGIKASVLVRALSLIGLIGVCLLSLVQSAPLPSGTVVSEVTPRLPRESGKVPDDWRAALPEPVLGAHPGWVDFYYETWRFADLKKTEYKGHTIFDTAFKPGKIWLWDTVWISHFGIYVQGANPSVTDPMAGYDLFYSAQREDGCIPHVWNASGEHS
ncbi:MAG: hypothetical protein EBY32_20890, partial [Proteobacteria bacterium]|nr:hypothetical protein [Pseudomonadota bacterium]